MAVAASAHVHGGGGQPDGIDADHLKDYLRMARLHCARSAAALVGQVRNIEMAPLRSSTLVRSELAVSGVAVAGSLTAMNAGTGGDVASG